MKRNLLKIFAIFLVILLTLSSVACVGDNVPPINQDTSTGSTSNGETLPLPDESDIITHTGICVDVNKDHRCDICLANVGSHNDALNDGDHVCDYGCGATLSLCLDFNRDHACDDCKVGVGVHSDKALDGDHLCDYGCGIKMSGCIDGNSDGICDECNLTLGHACIDEDIDHKCDICQGPLTACEDKDKDHACDYGCPKIFGDCTDNNNDHNCDYGCSKTFGTHADGNDTNHLCDYGCGAKVSSCADGNNDGRCDQCNAVLSHTCVDNVIDHKCDICQETLTACEDKDKDHDCDNGCAKTFGTHADGNKDHNCDYGCATKIGTCADSNKDHACDYGCSKTFGTHADGNKDHNCDYGCATKIGTCADSNKDHACDYGCSKTFGTHADGSDTNHLCDYGCGAKVSSCADGNNDGRCDQCNAVLSHTCVDNVIDHKCDICQETLTACEDKDKDHDCDNGCAKTFGTHSDGNKDHNCDYGCATKIGTCADSNKDHACDYGCSKTFGTHADGNKDHNCDYGCATKMGTCADSNKDHACDYGCSKTFGTHADGNKDHNCDYGCADKVTTCTDGDNNHKCDICGATMSICADKNSDHKCDICRATLTYCTDADVDYVCDVCKEEIMLSIFANNAYSVKFIRPANPTALDNKVYNEISALFKAKTGVNVVTASEGYADAAIVIGTTACEESVSENAKLAYGSASAQIIGNKYVITYSNAVAAAKMVTSLRKLLNGKNGSSLIADSSWAISFTDAESRVKQTFDSTGIKDSVTLPAYEGSALVDSNGNPLNAMYAGQKSYIYKKTNATLQSFDNFCSALYVAGFSYYTNNQVGDNQFATYVTNTQIVNVMYFKATSEVRITTDRRGKGNGSSAFDLPALSGDVSYTKTAEPSLTMLDISDTGYGGGMCFIYRLPDGKFFIVDSGINKQGSSTTSSAPIIYDTLKSLAGSEKVVVAGWLITHVHSDHLGGLYDMATATGTTYDKIRKNVTIEQIIHNEPTDEVTQKLDGLTSSTADYKKIWAWMNPIANAFGVNSVIKAHPGQVLHYAGIDITILSSQDVVLDIHEQYPDDRKVGGKGLVDSNDLSVTSQVSFNGKTVLMLGDALQKTNGFLATVYGKNLKSDILQAAHHGFNSTGADTSSGNPKGVNQLCAPSITLWSANDSKLEYVIERCGMNKYLVNNTVGYGAHDGNVTFDKNWTTKSKDVKQFAFLTNGVNDFAS